MDSPVGGWYVHPITERPRLLAISAILFVFVVVQVALAGSSDSGPRATSSASLKRQVSTLKKRVAALEGKTDQIGQAPTTLPPSGAAGGALVGAYPNPSIAPGAVGTSEIGQDAVGASETMDLQRSINLPIGSFVNCTDGETIDFADAADDDPDFNLPGAGRPSILWEAGDTDSVCTSARLPPDTVTNTTVSLRWTSIAVTGSEDWLFTTLRQRPGVAEDTGIATGSISNCGASVGNGVAYVCSGILNDTYQANDTVTVGIARSAGGSLRLYGAELRYTAAQ